MTILCHPNISTVLVQSAGSDTSIANAARVSTGSLSTPENDYKLIEFLMKHRHGTPFEHCSMTFLVRAPIFVWREHHRHRIGWSYNEESGRYKELRPEFWIPSPERCCIPVPEPSHCTNSIAHSSTAVQLVKKSNGVMQCPACSMQFRYHHSARPCLQAADKKTYDSLVHRLRCSYHEAYSAYQLSLNEGIVKEVARACLPVSIYSSCYTTCNPRSLMHFLSLRTHDEDAAFVSYPQAEIQEVAAAYEEAFSQLFPATHEAFRKNGRVAP